MQQSRNTTIKLEKGFTTIKTDQGDVKISHDDKEL